MGVTSVRVRQRYLSEDKINNSHQTLLIIKLRVTSCNPGVTEFIPGLPAGGQLAAKKTRSLRRFKYKS